MWWALPSAMMTAALLTCSPVRVLVVPGRAPGTVIRSGTAPVLVVPCACWVRIAFDQAGLPHCRNPARAATSACRVATATTNTTATRPAANPITHRGVTLRPDGDGLHVAAVRGIGIRGSGLTSWAEQFDCQSPAVDDAASGFANPAGSRARREGSGVPTAPSRQGPRQPRSIPDPSGNHSYQQRQMAILL